MLFTFPFVSRNVKRMDKNKNVDSLRAVQQLNLNEESNKNPVIYFHLYGSARNGIRIKKEEKSTWLKNFS